MNNGLVVGVSLCRHAFVFSKSKLFPTVVVVDIPFPLTVGNCSIHFLGRRDLFTEHFPTVRGKRDVHYNDRREKFVFQFRGTVEEGGGLDLRRKGSSIKARMV